LVANGWIDRRELALLDAWLADVAMVGAAREQSVS
jgi:hypothetical protein